MIVKSIHTIYDGKKSYGPGETLSVNDGEGQRLIDCGAAVFVPDEDEEVEPKGKKAKGK